MKKQFIAGMLVGSITFGAVGVFAGQYAATENPFPVQLNGTNVSLEGYNINDNTYFKLRDIADVVGGFTVGFENNTIQLAKDGYQYNSPETPEQDIRSIISRPLVTADEVKDFYEDGSYYYSGNFYAKVNSAGGVEFNWCAINISDKPIKYITFTMRLYNGVGDLITDDVFNADSFRMTLVGPLEPNFGFHAKSPEPFAYTYQCAQLSIDEMTVEFMDGSSVTGYYGYSTDIIR